MNPENLSPRRDALADDATIEAAAAVWLGMRDDGLTPRQEAEFDRWLAEDARHAKIFAELTATWAALDRLRAARPAGDGAPDPALLAPYRHGWRSGVVPTMLALAAAVVFVFVIWRQPAHAGMILAQSAATEVGIQKKMSLPDGSIMQLNTDSAVEVNYTPVERRVRLVRGEVLFTVAKNPARPFIVNAGGVDVRAVGTAFNVRLRADRVEVLVTEGKVRVDDAVKGESLLQPRADAARQLLVAGERASIPVSAAAVAPAVVATVAPQDIERALAWQDRRLEFVSVPLAEVVAEFNRYNQHKLVIADPRIESQRFGGTFRADGYDAFVRLLESNFGIAATRAEHETVLRLAK